MGLGCTFNLNVGMSGAQAKIFMSCGRLLAWPFGVEMCGRLGDGSGKMQSPRTPTFSLVLKFTRYYLYLILKFSPVVCRKISEATQIREWLL